MYLQKILDALPKKFKVTNEQNLYSQNSRLYSLKDEDNLSYMLKITTSFDEHYLLKRDFEIAKYLSKEVLYQEFGNRFSYVLYKDTDINLQDTHKQKLTINEENIKKIVDDYLFAFEKKYHSFIKRYIHKYIKLLQDHKELETYLEYNALEGIEDFSRSCIYQPQDTKIFQLKNEIKNSLTKAIKENTTHIHIYDNFEDDLLKKEWQQLYNNGAIYNLSYNWCKTWSRHFLDKNSLFIFTIWQDETLVLLVPLVKKDNLYQPIGLEPSLYDSFDILYSDEKYIVDFFMYMEKNRFNIHFKYIDTSSSLAKIAIRYFYQNKVKYRTKIADNKPFVYLENFNFKKKEKHDYVRLKNRADDFFAKEVIFEFDSAKNHSSLQEFMSIHKNRWDGGIFKKEKIVDFFKDILQDKSVVLSKLFVDDVAIAYHFGYIDSKNTMHSFIPAYSKEYENLSPGKLLLFHIIESAQKHGLKKFDFGRGAEGYKYWFATDDTILLHLYTKLNYGLYKKFIKSLFRH